MKGVPERIRMCHGGDAIGAFGGAPYRATQRASGAPQWARRYHAGALEPSMELPIGRRNV
eukprot:3052779-Pyramimonas_sp.AAC.1